MTEARPKPTAWSNQSARKRAINWEKAILLQNKSKRIEKERRRLRKETEREFDLNANEKKKKKTESNHTRNTQSSWITSIAPGIFFLSMYVNERWCDEQRSIWILFHVFIPFALSWRCYFRCVTNFVRCVHMLRYSLSISVHVCMRACVCDHVSTQRNYDLQVILFLILWLYIHVCVCVCVCGILFLVYIEY